MTELDTIKRAKMYMEKLSQGVNPIDGTPVPEGDLTRNARMSRCFAYVAQVLDKVVTNTAARAAKTQPSAPKAAPEIISAFRKVAFILFLALKKYCFL